MKKLLFLFASLLLVNTTAIAKTNMDEADTSFISNARGYGNSFIFNEAGIEFSVFSDGQFDFFMPNFGPNVNVGINTPGFALSFNTGYDYNPYVQYDSFGAIVQIENTPIFYDYFGRVNQIGNIVINYNGFGRVHRIGSLNVYYRNNVFWRYDGFINVYNRTYVWRPWHRYYAVPSINYCIVNTHPYRQFYTPIRHIYYRPYRNNIRHYNVNNGRLRNDLQTRRNSATRYSSRYAQAPRNERDRIVRKAVKSRNNEITRTRTSHLRENRIANKSRGLRNSNDQVQKRKETNLTKTNSRALTKNRATSSRVSANSRTKITNAVSRSKKNVTSYRASVSKKVERIRKPSIKKPNTSKSRKYAKSKSNNTRELSKAQNKRKSSSVTTRSNTSRKNNQNSKSYNSRRSRG